MLQGISARLGAKASERDYSMLHNSIVPSNNTYCVLCTQVISNNSTCIFLSLFSNMDGTCLLQNFITYLGEQEETCPWFNIRKNIYLHHHIATRP